MTRRVKTINFWTPKEELLLESLRMEGQTYKQIASVLGRTWQSVQNKVRQLRIPLGRSLERWAAILARPAYNRVLCKELGVSLRTIYNYKKRLRELGYVVRSMPTGLRSDYGGNHERSA